MSYPWTKSLHLAAALIFCGGLMLLAVVLSARATPGKRVLLAESSILKTVLQWDRCVTAPALAVVWALGLGLALWGNWMGQGWLLGKAALVLALSALHGVLSAALRRDIGGADSDRETWLKHIPAAVAFALAAVAALVIVKP